jgi:hypothetical protein
LRATCVIYDRLGPLAIVRGGRARLGGLGLEHGGEFAQGRGDVRVVLGAQHVGPDAQGPFEAVARAWEVALGLEHAGERVQGRARPTQAQLTSLLPLPTVIALDPTPPCRVLLI